MSKLTPEMRKKITMARQESIEKARENFKAQDADGDGELTI